MIRKKSAFLLILLGLFPAGIQAQQSVFYVSKGLSGPDLAGESLTYTDFWFRPESGQVSQAGIEIFDGSLGGQMDILTGAADTKTRFELIPFQQVYQVTADGLIPVTGPVSPSAAMDFLTEPAFINRWTRFPGTLSPSENGWILRVKSGEGNDVNSFNIRIAGNTAGWQLLGLDLNLGISGIRDNQEVQLLPELRFSPAPVSLKTAGEEDSRVFIRDGAGKILPPAAPESAWETELNGRPNLWGLTISSSRLKVNNMTIRGEDHPVVFSLPASVVTVQTAPAYSIKADYIGDCTRFRLTLLDRGKPVKLQDKIFWKSGEFEASGNPVEVEFGRPGKKPVSVSVATDGILLPAFWVTKTELSVNAPPKAVLEVPARRLGTGEVLLLSAGQSSDPDGDPLNFKWQINGASAGSGSPFPFSASFPGTYTVGLTVTDQSDRLGCGSDYREIQITVNSQPFTEVSYPAVIATGTQVQFSTVKTADADQDPLSWKWSGPGVSGTADQPEVKVLHQQPGVYSLTLAVDDGQKTPNSVYTTTISYRSNAKPEPRFTLPVQSAPGIPVQLNSGSSTDSDSRNLDFLWSVSDGRKLSGPLHSISFDRPGDYTVTLQVDDGEKVENSVQTLTRSIHINFPPVPVISAEKVSPESYQEFSAGKSSDADQGIIRFSWDFGDGVKAEGKDVSHTYSKTGKYQVTLRVDDGQNQPNSSQAVSQELIIVRFPVARFSVPDRTAPGVQVVLDGSSSSDPDGEISSYEWRINGAATSSDSKTSWVPDQPGRYSISLTVRDNSGFDVSENTLSAIVSVNYPPVPAARISPMAASPGQPVSFDASASQDPDGQIKSVQWLFSDGQVLTGNKVSRQFSSSGEQSVILTVSDGAGFPNSAVSDTLVFLINHPPIIVTQKSIRLNSRSVSLDASGSYDPDGDPVAFEWILPGGERRTESAFTWLAPGGGLHLVSLVIRDSHALQNSSTAQKIEIRVNRPPIAKVDTLITACSGQTILFNGSSSYDPDGDGISTAWDFGDGSRSSETNPAKVYFQPGFYQVRLSLSDGFAPEPVVATIPVVIKGSPVARIPFSDTTICVGTLLSLDGGLSTDPNGPIGAYTWDYGNGDRELGQTVNYIYKEKGEFNLSLTVVGTPTGNCSNISQTTAKVTVIEGPRADFSFKPWVSVGEEVVFDASGSSPESSLDQAAWEVETPAGIVKETGKTIRYAFTGPGVFKIRLVIRTESKTDCNVASIEKKIRVNAPPEIAWSIPDSAAFGSYLLLDAEKSSDPDGILTELNWLVDGIPAGSEPKLALPVTQTGKLTVTLSVRDDSPTRTNRVSRTKTILVNQSPEPEFSVPPVVYAGEQISLSPSRQMDADGDLLHSVWTVENSPVSFPLTVKEGTGLITLTQNDGRGFSNSTASRSVKITGIPAPVFPNPFPSKVITGTVLSQSSAVVPPAVFLLTGKTPVQSVTLATAGKATVQVGWKPKLEVLKIWSFDVLVLDPIRFTQKPAGLTKIWNPGNPSVTLKAPQLNRTELNTVEIRWYAGSAEIGRGTELTVPLKKGENKFILKARDLDIPGSPGAETEWVVICK